MYIFNSTTILHVKEYPFGDHAVLCSHDVHQIWTIIFLREGRGKWAVTQKNSCTRKQWQQYCGKRTSQKTNMKQIKKTTTTTKKQNILLNKLMLEIKNTCSEPPTPPPLENIMVYPYMSLSRYFTEITSRSQSRKKGLRVLDLQLISHYIISTQKLTSNEGYSLDVPANSHN